MEKNPNNQKWYDPTTIMKKDNPEILSCKKCGCHWFEQIVVQQYSKYNTVILGQKVPSIVDQGFFIFRCPKCLEVYEPNIQIGPQDSMRKSYDDFLDQMEAPMPEKEDPSGEQL